MVCLVVEAHRDVDLHSGPGTYIASGQRGEQQEGTFQTPATRAAQAHRSGTAAVACGSSGLHRKLNLTSSSILVTHGDRLGRNGHTRTKLEGRARVRPLGSEEMKDNLLNRRSALQTAGGLAGLALIGGMPFALGGCESLLKSIRNRPMRRSLRTLAANDPIMETYRAAISAMKALPASDRRNWNAQAQVHFDHCPHGNWYFLPWHRAYLLYFEQICRQLTGENGFALPYWNWTCQRQIPVAFLGDASNPLFVSGRSGVPPAALSDEVVGPAVMSGILDEPNFDIFASSPAAALRPGTGYGPLEATPHNSVHGFVGGIMGSFQSPRDPLFWMHHNMIERVWWDWNGVLGNANTNDPVWNQFSLGGMFADRQGTVIDNVTVGLLNLAPLLSYRFDADPFTHCGLVIKPWVIADELALRRLLEEGGRVVLRIQRSVARAGAFELPVGQAATRALSIADVPQLADITRRSSLRLLLRVQPQELPATGEFFVRVFVNLPQAGPDTPIDVPQYAGSFAFFNDPDAHSHHGPEGAEGNAAFLVDLGAVLHRLRAGGAALGDSVGVHLVAVPQRPGAMRTQALKVRALELQLVESSAPPQNPLGAKART